VLAYGDEERPPSTCFETGPTSWLSETTSFEIALFLTARPAVSFSWMTTGSALSGEALAEVFEAGCRVFEWVGGAVEEEVGGFDCPLGTVLVLQSADDFKH
jgi:hypothetical protein